VEEDFSSREISEWMAYASIEPFGEGAANVRTGVIASTIANRHRDPKREKQAYTVQQFTPFLDHPTSAATTPDVSETLKQMFAHVPKKKA
jgi:hypothetical protein